MKTKTFAWLFVALIICTGCEPGNTTPEDTTKFTNSSLVGIWAEVGDIGGYQEGQEAYSVRYYYDIKSKTKLKYMQSSGKYGVYNVSDGYLHISPDYPWGALVDATYSFEEEEQTIRCTAGTFIGYEIESVQKWLGSDTFFAVRRLGIDEAEIYDKTGWLRSVHVFRVKGIKKDLQ